MKMNLKNTITTPIFVLPTDFGISISSIKLSGAIKGS